MTDDRIEYEGGTYKPHKSVEVGDYVVYDTLADSIPGLGMVQQFNNMDRYIQPVAEGEDIIRMSLTGLRILSIVRPIQPVIEIPTTPGLYRVRIAGGERLASLLSTTEEWMWAATSWPVEDKELRQITEYELVEKW